MPDKLYGLDGDEKLIHIDPDDVIIELLNDACGKVGESFAETADRMQWPVTVYEWQPRKVEQRDIRNACELALECVLEHFDEEYGPPDDYTTPTEGMKSAARVFVTAILSEYHVWQCEQVDIVEYTREQARAVCP